MAIGTATTTGPNLFQLILADDADAIAGFRDAHIQKVRAYCEEACPSDLVDEARDSAFVDFLGRLRLSTGEDVDLEELLLKATRAAAAGRFALQQPGDAAGRRAKDPEQICLAMPELLAAYANAELQSDEQHTRRHVERCQTCTATIERMARAERRFAGARGWDEPAPMTEEGWGAESAAGPPAPEAEPAAEAWAEPPAGPAPPEPARAESEHRPGPEPPAAADPTPPPTPAPPPTPQVAKGRRGGLIGATRRLVGRPRKAIAGRRRTPR